MSFDKNQVQGTAFVLSAGMFEHSNAKTAHGLIRGSERFTVKAVIDPVSAGKDAGEVLDGKHRNIPIYATLAEALAAEPKPDFCIIGVATVGGVLPPDLADIVREAIQSGISIINGLHDFLNERPDMVALAEKHGATLVDVRRPKAKKDLHFWSGKVFSVGCPILAVMGMDCAMGKRTTARFIRQTCNAAGIKSEMIYTGQTGWMQGNRYGFVFDSTLNDFVSGELEHAIVSAYEQEKTNLILIEGQSSLRNPSGPCGSEFLVSGNAKHVVLIHEIKREFYGDEPTWGKIPPVESEIKLIEMYNSKVIALSLNTKGCTLEEAKAAQAHYAQALGIPVLLPLEEGVEALLPIIQSLILEKNNQ